MLVAQGRTIGQVCKEAEITERSCYRWRNEYGGLEIEQAKRFKVLEWGSARLKRLVADLNFDKAMLQDTLRKNGKILREAPGRRPFPGGLRGERAEGRPSDRYGQIVVSLPIAA